MDDGFSAEKNGASKRNFFLEKKLISPKNAGVGRRNESCRHRWLFLGALNSHFLIFTLRIFCHLPTSEMVRAK